MLKLTALTLCSFLFLYPTGAWSQTQHQKKDMEVAARVVSAQSSPKPNTHPEITTIGVGHGPQGIAFTPGSVWVAYGDDKDYGVVRIDADTNKVVATVRTGKSPGPVAAGEGAVWIGSWDENSVTRVDPETNRVTATIAVGKKPFAVEVGEGAIWVTNAGSNTVSRIDPKTNAVIATIPVGKRPGGIAISDGSAWVANFAGKSVSRIDPKTNTVLATIKVEGNPVTLTSRGSDVWVTSEVSGVSILRIDAKSNSVVAQKVITPGGKVGGLAILDGFLWVVDRAHAFLWQIDIQTNAILGQPVQVGNYPIILGTGTDGNGAIWVSNTSDGTVMKVKP